MSCAGIHPEIEAFEDKKLLLIRGQQACRFSHKQWTTSVSILKCVMLLHLSKQPA
jgi:hypothetical protein